MNFVQIQNMVLADGFAEGKRADAKRWINSVYQTIWDMEGWPFKNTIANISVTQGQQTVSLPSDFSSAIFVLDQYGDRLRPIDDVRQFLELHGDSSVQGQPRDFTIVGAATMYLGPTPDKSGTYRLYYTRAVTPLSADSDVPLIPEGYHMALVLGARIQGSAQLKLPVFEAELREYDRMVQSMRLNYLSVVSGEEDQIGAFRP